MSVELVNTCVVLPHRANWKKPPSGRRGWATSIAQGVQNSEDRAAGRTDAPMTLEYTVLTKSQRERAMLNARILEALKRGRAACPSFGFGVDTISDATGQKEVSLTPCRRKVWATGDYVIFARPNSDLFNDVRRVNCGGDDLESFKADDQFTGGDSGFSVASILTAGTWVTGSDYTISGDSTEAAPSDIYVSFRSTFVAAGNPAPFPIVYTFDNCEPEEYLVRLHFAETVFDGTTENTNMAIDIEGWSKITLPNFIPTDYAPVNTPVILERRVRPDRNGRVLIRVQANGNEFNGNWNAYICGIELLSYTWETRQLISGSNAGLMTWNGRLMGTYPAGTTLHQLHFGTPSIVEGTAHTDYYGEFRIAVAQPLGDGALSVAGQCADEICDPDGLLPEVGDPGAMPGCAETLTMDTGYYWGLDADKTPNEFLTGGQIACHKAIASILFQDMADADPDYTYTKGKYFWFQVPGSESLKLSGLYKFNSGECNPNTAVGDHLILFSVGSWSLGLTYCRVLNP